MKGIETQLWKNKEEELINIEVHIWMKPEVDNETRHLIDRKMDDFINEVSAIISDAVRRTP